MKEFLYYQPITKTVRSCCSFLASSDIANIVTFLISKSKYLKNRVSYFLHTTTPSYH